VRRPILDRRLLTRLVPPGPILLAMRASLLLLL